MPRVASNWYYHDVAPCQPFSHVDVALHDTKSDDCGVYYVASVHVVAQVSD